MSHGESGHAPHALSVAAASVVAETMQALATPSRVRILGRLAAGPCSVSELAVAVGMEPSAVSHQLRLLRHLGLIVGHREGRRVVYDLYDDHVGELLGAGDRACRTRSRRPLAAYWPTSSWWAPEMSSSPRSEPAVADRGHSDGHGHDDHANGGNGHGGHGHTHGLVDPSIKRSRAGLRAVFISFGVLALAAVAQTLIFALSGSVALLADLIHNFGDALTAVPLAVAFLMRSERAERTAGLFVVAAIFISACVAGIEAVSRLIHPHAPTHLLALAARRAIGYLGNHIAALVRTRAGTRLDSPALIADGNHARADAYVSLAVIASAARRRDRRPHR